MNEHGKTYWRSLAQKADTPEFREFLEREFPKGTVELANNKWTRRSFLSTMGASMALAGLAGCRRPVEKIVPYVTRPEEIDPGVANQYATTMPFGESALGLLVTSREGRPIKIEGNALHPSSLGAVNPIVQASLLNLYDPDRSQTVLKDGREASWDDFVTFWTETRPELIERQGQGFAILTEPFTSPTMTRLKRAFVAAFPKAIWASHSIINDANIVAGIQSVTGEQLRPVHKYGQAKVILSLDSDFLGTESESIAAARGFADGRRVTSQADGMNRLYVLESALTITGMTADHRLRSKSSEIALKALAIAHALKQSGVGLDLPILAADVHLDTGFVNALIDDLLANRGASVIVAGRRQPAEVHALVYALNEALSNNGQTISYTNTDDYGLSDTNAFAELSNQLSWKNISTLVILGGNPAYASPRLLGLDGMLKSVRSVIHLGSHLDETAKLAHWHLPQSHYLEMWSDARAVDGALSVVQPLIAPLYDSRSELEVLHFLTTGEAKSGHDLVRETWQPILTTGNFENQWRRVLHDGLFVQPSSTGAKPRFQSTALTTALTRANAFRKPTDDGLEVVFFPSNVWDGRFANNGWLQELPDPVTKITWDNVALVSPTTAAKHDLSNGDVVKVSIKSVALEIPAWISPGQADDTVALALGYGRTAAGRVGTGVGFDSYMLMPADGRFIANGAEITKTGRTAILANTQDHGSMEGRPIVRENTLTGYKESGRFFPEEAAHPPLVSLWNEHTYDKGYQWGMTIDLNICTGCNACVTACQAENNIPVVGKEQTSLGREMHWMRLDRYYAGDESDPEVVVQPMNCQHCETAPCEQVCPVAATVHDDEGLNVMVYNRCIGTRYCSNNCPYKVRRFNFFNYTKDLPESIQMAQNPEVTVRFRGVMEKCSYCVQRINTAKITAKNEGREVVDGEVITACQQACPTRAIQFGNIRDAQSAVAKAKQNDRNYAVLEGLNTRPRTTYLAKLRNPHPSLAKTDMHSTEGDKHNSGAH